jgi:hypothetical protein
MTLITIGILLVVAVIVIVCMKVIYPFKSAYFSDDEWDNIPPKYFKTGSGNQHFNIDGSVRKTRSDKGQKRAPYAKRVK